jgi:uncharacterized membrane protein YkvA (DUF1232 family)
MKQNQLKKSSFIKENWFLFLVLIYLISPFDIVPDILIPILGPFVFIDDLGLILIELIRRFRGKKKKPINKLEEKLLADEVEEAEIIKD